MKYHFIGIGGIGMSGLARILIQKGHEVTGSDIVYSVIIEDLKKIGARVAIGHNSQAIYAGLIVVYSTAIKEDNPEYKAALKLRCQLMHRSELLYQLMQGYKGLVITGTHGKTTTSSIVASVMQGAGMSPSFSLGGVGCNSLPNGHHGEGEYFVAEADESDGSFLLYPVFGAIVTNIGSDHLDYYGSIENIQNTFKAFFQNINSHEYCLWFGDDQRLRSFDIPGISYGFGTDCRLRIVRFKQKGWKQIVDIVDDDKLYKDIEVSLIGEYNLLNVLAAFGLLIRLGIDEKVIRKELSSFEGVCRRQEYKEVNNITIIDDYAHHPTEIRSVLLAIRKTVKEKRIIAVFQPHRYSRVSGCKDLFKNSFENADLLIITDIYPAGEKPIEGISHETIINSIKAYSNVDVRYVANRYLEDFLINIARPHDVIITIGAGDITNVYKSLFNYFSKNPPNKLIVGILCGGRSVEHDISLQSACFINESLCRRCYDVKSIGITRQGKWVFSKSYSELPKALNKTSNKNPLLVSQLVMKEIYSCDIIIPMLHGPFGEDGTMQGFLEILNKPYVGSDHRSSALCMEKGITKHLMKNFGVPTLPFESISIATWEDSRIGHVDNIVNNLKFPVFVKPSHLGSSIGVHKVNDVSTLIETIDKVLKIDTHIIVEQGIEAREIEFAVLGNHNLESFPGEVCTNGEIYSYEKKYGENGFSTLSCPDLTKKQLKEGQHLAEKAYRIAGCSGLARVDFFFDKKHKFWLNEINPIPGFTSISLYHKIWAARGLDIQNLLHRLIILGLHRSRLQNRCFNNEQKKY